MSISKLLIFLLGIVTVVVVLSFFGIAEVIAILLHTRLEILLICALLQLVALGFIALRIKILSHGKGYTSWNTIVRLTLSGYFVSMITPLAKMGGEPLKMYMLGKNIGKYNASAVVAIESVAELISSFVVVLLIALFFFGFIPGGLVPFFILFLLIIGAGIGILIKILSTPRWLYKIGRWINLKSKKFFNLDKTDHTTLFYTSFNAIWDNRTVVFGAVAVSVLSKLFEIFRFWFIFMALGVFVPLQVLVVVWAILLVVMFIPWLPGSMGLVELSAISALTALGIAQTAAASGIVLDRFISFWLPLAVGMWALHAAKTRGELPVIKLKK